MLLLFVLLAMVPVYARVQAEPFYVILFARVLIFAIAALSLDLILGVAGLVSFGHALYLGIGAYAAGILAQHGIDNGWVHVGVAVGMCAAVGLVTGLVSLRTAGIAFIMITLAFAQMGYFLAVSLKDYGGDDGLPLAAASRFGSLSLADPVTLYCVALAMLALLLLLGRRMLKARFGMTLAGIRMNPRRMRALGVATLHYTLAAYVSAAVLCGLAGVLLANLTQFVSPSTLSWTTSGELIVMVVIGGLGTFAGPVLGALAMVLVEEGLKAATEHWMVYMGPLIVVVVLVSKRGLIGVLQELDARRARGATRTRPADGAHR
ncbi:amino acid/amide ABC transporter membrane protein 2, HAAT family [Chitinasiproducens palmae]|uniref:Amino acid/amide ABC transporter membrane protein 2, HAAT family n=2 Tax=Chitinasiproducens palmae TaxID=1770053 RepID=A0A1H2PVK2_9BURK|nr:amino acid/amide ABC transporter membrane protein 2, HAAT family [Chitinasiproducens palmae]